MPKKLDANKVVRVIIFIAPFFIFFLLGWRYFALSGNLKLSYDFSKESTLISEFTPRGRASDREKNLRTAETYQQIVGEPVYMDVNVPRAFDEVKVTLKYTNPSQNILEFGIVSSEEPWNVQLFPVENKIIDEGLASWAISEGGKVEEDINGKKVTLLQGTPQFQSLQDFLNSFPKDKKVGLYRFNLDIPYFDPNYTAGNKEFILDKLLRGKHEFLVYIKNEPLVMSLSLRDINWEFNEDPVTVTVKNSEETYFNEYINDDGVAIASSVISASREVNIFLPDLKEGVYSILMEANDDVVIESLRTRQQKFVVKNRLFIINNDAYLDVFPEINTSATDIYFAAPNLVLITDHPQGLQKITIENQALNIEKLHEPVWWFNAEASTNEDLKKITLPKNDLQLGAKDSFFTFNVENYFDPNYQARELNEETKLADLDFIVYADYLTPVSNRLYSTQVVSIDLDLVYGDRKKLTFVLSAPGIDRGNSWITMRDMEFEFKREPLTVRLKKRFFGK